MEVISAILEANDGNTVILKNYLTPHPHTRGAI